jgi:hypothetical protein
VEPDFPSPHPTKIWLIFGCHVITTALLGMVT